MYEELSFSRPIHRPFFYTNFVETVDGKIQVVDSPNGYWPIGSAFDYKTLLELRAHADVLIHGKTTAQFIRTIDNLGKPEFQQRRKKLGKKRDILYVVISAHPTKELIEYLTNPPSGVQALLCTTNSAKVPKELKQSVAVIRFGTKHVDLSALSAHLFKHNYHYILVEGGPTVLGSFLQAGLMDEVFVTIAPKIFGNAKQKTLSMVEGVLFQPERVKKLQLLSVHPVENEVYLRYAVRS